MIQRTRGSQITLRTKTDISSCSALMVDEALASYSWSLLAANESRAGEQVAIEVGRDPRVLSIPPYTLGLAGSSYLFQFRSAVGDETATTANATGELSVVSVVSRRWGPCEYVVRKAHNSTHIPEEVFPVCQLGEGLAPGEHLENSLSIGSINIVFWKTVPTNTLSQVSPRRSRFVACAALNVVSPSILSNRRFSTSAGPNRP